MFFDRQRFISLTFAIALLGAHPSAYGGGYEELFLEPTPHWKDLSSPAPRLKEPANDAECCDRELESTSNPRFRIRPAEEVGIRAGHPVAYLFEQPIVSGGTLEEGDRFVITIPPSSTFLEAGAVSLIWGNLEPLNCEAYDLEVECVVPPDHAMRLPFAMSFVHDEPGATEISVTIDLENQPEEYMGHQVIFNGVVEPDNPDPVVVDVLFLYQPDPDDGRQEEKLRRIFDSWIDYSNAVLRRSEVKIILRNIGLHPFETNSDYDMRFALADVMYSEKYANLRYQFGADFAVYVRGYEARLCGVAFQARPGLPLSRDDISVSAVNLTDDNVCKWTPASTFLHEIGHTMGLGHGPEVPRRAGPYGYWTFAGGHGEGIGFDPNGNAYHLGTMMSHNTTNFFSNPNITCPTDRPCGRPIGSPDAADSATALNALRWMIAAARPSIVPPDDSDVGIFVRGIDAGFDRHGVRIVMQNYSSRVEQHIDFEVTTPAGWRLLENSLGDACNQSDDTVICQVEMINAFERVFVDLEFQPGLTFDPPITAKLLLEDAFEGNNEGWYDPDYQPTVDATHNSEQMSDGLWRGGISFGVASHDFQEIPMQLGIRLPASYRTADLRNMHVRYHAGFDFEKGIPKMINVDCEIDEGESNDVLILCPEVEISPQFDDGYVNPPGKWGAVVSVLFSRVTDPLPAEFLFESRVPGTPSEVIFHDQFQPAQSSDGPGF